MDYLSVKSRSSRQVKTLWISFLFAEKKDHILRTLSCAQQWPGDLFRAMRRRTIVKVTFMFSCLLLFLYKTYEVFNCWRENEIVTKIYHDKQENLPMPLICLSTRNRNFYIRNSNDINGVGTTKDTVNLSLEVERTISSVKNLTYKDYKNGTWNLDGITAENLYDKITPNLSDLVYRISIQKTNASIGYWLQLARRKNIQFISHFFFFLYRNRFELQYGCRRLLYFTQLHRITQPHLAGLGGSEGGEEWLLSISQVLLSQSHKIKISPRSPGDLHLS